ncbi:MAG: hypothetical protein M3209_09730 [Acidobacteriota bacterium]|nr:hypothetical protein [Acidobacteriota bacterium]
MENENKVNIQINLQGEDARRFKDYMRRNYIPKKGVAGYGLIIRGIEQDERRAEPSQIPSRAETITEPATV